MILDLIQNTVPKVLPEDDGSSDSFDCLSTPNDTAVSLPPDGSAPRVRVHHPRYYVKDDMTVFLVNDEILFRVHRWYLDRESEVFRSYPSGTDENPVPLPGVLPHEFEALLEYFYDSVHDDVEKSCDDWTSLLSVSTHFKMERVRNRAIAELGDFDLDPVDKIVLAMNHDVPAWLKPAYIELCQREEPIREEEAEMLGLSTMVKVAHAREKARDGSPARALEVPQPNYSGSFLEPTVTSRRATSAWLQEPCAPAISPSPTEEKFGTAYIERVVTDIFWPILPNVSSESESSDAPAMDVAPGDNLGGMGMGMGMGGGGKAKGKKGKKKK